MTIELFEPLTKPTAAQLNAIGSNQTALDAIYVGVASVLLQAEGGTGAAFGFIHLHRWLLFNSAGQLEDPSGVNDPISLSDPEDAAEIGLLDLNTIDWLAVGAYYRVSSVAAAWEAAAPPAGNGP